RQTVLEDWKPSAGHAALDPVQLSATSHEPAEARQTVLEDWKASAGHAALDPVQLSATSHEPAEARQTVLEDWKPSAGHAALDPVQLSATSQGPAEARHTVPALPAAWLHAPPLRVSVVQGFPSSVQPVPFGWKASGGQAELGGASAMSWLTWAVLVLGAPDVDAFEPLAPGVACNTSALSEDASVVVPPELELWTLNRSVMPDGAPTALLSERPKQPPSIVLAAVVGIDGVARLAVPLLLVAAPRNPMMIAPGQVCATSHSPAAGRHTVPPLPGGCWQLVLVPSQVSAVQGSPSSVHAAPALPAGC